MQFNKAVLVAVTLVASAYCASLDARQSTCMIPSDCNCAIGTVNAPIVGTVPINTCTTGTCVAGQPPITGSINTILGKVTYSLAEGVSIYLVAWYRVNELIYRLSGMCLTYGRMSPT